MSDSVRPHRQQPTSPAGSPVPRILQTRTLEWVAISFFSAWKWKVKVKSLSRVRLLATPWTVAHQAPPSMGFSSKSTGVGWHCLLQELWLQGYIATTKSTGYIATWASLLTQSVKNPPAMQETQVWSLGWENPLEKEMATHSSILARRIPWTEAPGRL